MGYNDSQRGFELYKTNDFGYFEKLTSIWDVRMLIQVMHQAGVGLQTKSLRNYWAVGVGREEEVEGTLETPFKLISGWLVTPEECEEISRKLSDQTFTRYWDVTDGDSPFVVPGGMLAETTAAGNHRSYFRTAVVLAPQRSYRVVARVKSHRATVISAPIDNGPLEILGGLLYEDATSCEGQRLVTAQELPDQVFLALRFNAAGLASERPDPLAGDLTLQKEVGGLTLHWPMIPGVAGYEILRCDATSAACVPAEHATASENRFTDEDLAANVIWYKVNAVRDCSSVFPRIPDPN